jgi:hypothetical protein
MGGEDPVPYSSNQQITLSGDASLDTAIGQISLGQQLARISEQAASYSLRPASGPGYAVTHTIGGGQQPMYMGAKVLRSSFNGSVVSITVKTERMPREMALWLSATGTV